MLYNQRGSILLIALIIAGGLAIGATVSLGYITQIKNQGRVVRIRHMMTEFEFKLIDHLSSSSAFTTSALSSVRVLDQSKLEQLAVSLSGKGSLCGNGRCAIRVVQNGNLPFWDDTRSLFSGLIQYTGDDVSINPTPVTYSVPREVLQNTNYQCPDLLPFISGFKKNGELICVGLPNPNSCDERPGDFVYSIGADLRVTCGSFAQIIECPAEQHIPKPGPVWNAGSRYNGWVSNGCVDRQDPYGNPAFRPL
jgi:hypothetical protein